MINLSLFFFFLANHDKPKPCLTRQNHLIFGACLALQFQTKIERFQMK